MRIFAFVVLLACGCAHLSKKPDMEELKPTIDTFHQRARWKDFRGAAELVVAERRNSFIKARLKANDDKDLFITDFQLEDAEVAPGAEIVAAVSKISWYRLPDTTEKSAVVTSTFVWREGKWWLEAQDSGPFEDMKPAADASGGQGSQKKRTPAVSGPAEAAGVGSSPMERPTRDSP